LSLGETHDSAANTALAHILSHTTNRDIVDAALTSISDRAGDVLKLLLADGKWSTSAAAEPILTAIVGQIARQRHANDLNSLVELLQPTGSNRRGPGAVALLKALSRLPGDVLAGNSPSIVKLRELRASASKSLVREARQVLEQASAPSDERVAAVEDLALDKFDNQRELLEQLLSPQESTAIHSAVLAACARFSSPDVAPLILSRYGQLSPAERTQATDVLLRRGPWAKAFVEYLKTEGIPLTTLDPNHVSRLQNYPLPKVRQLVLKMSGQSIAADRQKVFAEYRDGGALAPGDAAQGKLVFEKNCATCHEIGGVGHQVGPNLASMVSRGLESVLFNLLAPNAEVDPRFIEYVVVTKDGQIINGVNAGETPTAVTIRGPENKTTIVLRIDIDEISNTHKSLMPEAFDKAIDKKSMANLLTFLQQAAAAQGGEK
jgi:putative heme-binding domain-containing protein